jgi:hypothetical protein
MGSNEQQSPPESRDAPSLGVRRAAANDPSGEHDARHARVQQAAECQERNSGFRSDAARGRNSLGRRSQIARKIEFDFTYVPSELSQRPLAPLN